MIKTEASSRVSLILVLNLNLIYHDRVFAIFQKFSCEFLKISLRINELNSLNEFRDFPGVHTFYGTESSTNVMFFRSTL